MNREKILEIEKALRTFSPDCESFEDKVVGFANAIIEEFKKERPKCPECGDVEAVSQAMHRCNFCGWEWYPQATWATGSFESYGATLPFGPPIIKRGDDEIK